MTPLTSPREVAQMPFVWGNILATPRGDYNPNRIYSLLHKNVVERGSQGPSWEGAKSGLGNSPCRPLDTRANGPRVLDSKSRRPYGENRLHPWTFRRGPGFVTCGELWRNSRLFSHLTLGANHHA